jgi:hypothetical protein
MFVLVFDAMFNLVSVNIFTNLHTGSLFEPFPLPKPISFAGVSGCPDSFYDSRLAS